MLKENVIIKCLIRKCHIRNDLFRSHKKRIFGPRSEKKPFSDIIFEHRKKWPLQPIIILVLL